MFDFDMPPLDWREARIPKKGKPGQFRKLCIPNDELKEVQRNILQYLYSIKALRPSIYAHGFIRHRNTCTGAQRHAKTTECILHMDVKDFFDNFPVNVAKERLLQANISSSLVEKIMTVCTYKDSFPQGSPCSPCLTNIGMFETDKMLGSFADKRGFTYSRYADDIILCLKEGVKAERSSYKHIFIGIDKLLQARLGLHLNRKKNSVSFMYGRESRAITGVVVRKDGMGYNAPMRMRRTARAMACNLARKLRAQGGAPRAEDYSSWAKLLGYIRYFDYIRSWSVGDASSADPIIQEKFFDELKEAFAK